MSLFRKLLILSLVAGIWMVTGCHRNQQNLTEQQRSAIADSIQQMMDRITSDAAGLNAESLFSPLDQDSSAWYFSDGMPYSFRTLKMAFSNLYSQLKTQQMIPVKTRVEVVSRDMAVWTGYLKSRYVTNGDQVVDQMLCETWIWQRGENGWKVTHYHESIMNLPSAEARAAVEVALGQLAGELSGKALDAENVKPMLKNLLEKNPRIFGSLLAFAPVEEDGKTTYAAPYYFRSGNEIKFLELPSDFNYTNLDWYAAPFQQKLPFWSNPYFDTGIGGVNMVTYSIPIVAGEGKFVGILTAEITL